MPKKFKRSKDKKQDQKLVVLSKKVNTLYQKEHLGRTFTQATFTAAYPTVLETASIADMGTALALTASVEGFGPAGRRSTKVKFTRIRGSFEVSLPATSTWAVGGVNHMRAMVIKVIQMPGVPGTHVLPNIRDIFQTAATLDSASINNYQSQEQAERNPNYKIVWDKRFDIVQGAASTFKCSKKSGMLQYLGTAPNHRVEFDIRPDNVQSTYDGTAATTASCDQNHYLFVVMNEFLTANNTPVLSGRMLLNYVSLA